MDKDVCGLFQDMINNRIHIKEQIAHPLLGQVNVMASEITGKFTVSSTA